MFTITPMTLKVAGVVSFYMSAALVVRILSSLGSNFILMTPIHRWFSCEYICGPQLVHPPDLHSSNKTVLNNSPDLPLLFLLIQLLIAVVLLHISAAFSKKIEIPKLDIQVAKKLVPVVLINIIGLVFNTLCLRDVEASFFQVRPSRVIHTKIPLILAP